MKARCLALLIGLSACSSSGTAQKLEQFVERICACDSTPCVDREMDALLEWASTLAPESNINDYKGDDRERVRAASERLSECTTQIRAKAETKAPGAPPEPPSPTEIRAEVVEAASAAVSGFADRACACTDVTCGEGVVGDYEKWSDEFAARLSVPLPGAAETLEESVKRVTFGDTGRLYGCLRARGVEGELVQKLAESTGAADD